MSNDGTQDDGKKNLSLESLDKVVGGASATPANVKKGVDADLLTGAKGYYDPAKGYIDPGKSSGIVAGDEKWVNPATTADMQAALYRNTIQNSLSQYLGGSNAADAGRSFDNFMKNGAGRNLTPAGWAIVYDVVLGSGFDNTDRRSPSEPDHIKFRADLQEPLKAKLRPYTEEITRGVVEKIKPGLSAQGALTTSINETGNVLAHLMSKADSPQVRDDLIAKAQAGYEKGLDTLKGMREYKAVADLISNPRSEDAWKTAVFEVGISAVSPTKLTIVKFLGEQMATSASLKFIGLGDYDPQVKQTARAMVNAMNSATDAVVDLYKNGFVAGMTMGLDVKGIIHIGQNVADFGKAVGKGDVDAMGKAAKALVVDALNDVKDGLEKFYVGGAIKVANWTKDITMGILNDLGATPYAEIAVQETKKAFVDFGNKAKDGSVAAINVLAEFATKDVARTGQQAINTLGDVAKSGAREAERAVNALGDVAKSGAREAEKAVNVLADVGKSGAREAEKAINTLADVAKSGGAYANVAIDQLKSLSGQFVSAANALEGVAKSGVKYAESAWGSVRGALEDTWKKIWPF